MGGVNSLKASGLEKINKFLGNIFMLENYCPILLEEKIK